MNLHFRNFYSYAEARWFVLENLTRPDSTTKPHEIKKSELFECWIVVWKGNLIKKR